MKFKKIILLSFTISLIGAPLFSQYLLEEVFTTTTFSKPLELIDPGDGTPRIFILNQRGIVNVLNADDPSNVGKIFLNISDRVSQSGFETGLLVKPVYEYDHNSSGGTSITGGYVSTAGSLPSLTNKYIFGDYTNGKIWALTYEGVPSPVSQLLIDSPYLISSFGKDKYGNIYICSIGNNKIYKLKDLTTGMEHISSAPSEFNLFQNYPNPFNPVTKINFGLPFDSKVTMKIFDITGKEIVTLVKDLHEAGYYAVTFDAGSIASGVYFYRIAAEGGSQRYVMTKKMLMIK